MPQTDLPSLESLIVEFKPGRAPLPPENAHRAFVGDQAREWERISNEFGGLELHSKEINNQHDYFFIDVPPGVNSVALLKALRDWSDVENAYWHKMY